MRGHQQRLRDVGLPNRVGIGIGAELCEVEPGHLRQCLQLGASGVVGEPGSQEARCLGALTWCEDC